MNANTVQAIGKNIWITQHPFKFFGVNFGNVMTIIKYEDSKLLLHSPLPLSPILIEQLDKLGEVSILMAPNLAHNLFINDWKQHYTNAILIAPQHIKKVDFDITLESLTLGNKKADYLPDNIHLQFIAGMKGLHEYVLIHEPSGTLVLTDLAFNIQTVAGIWSKLFFKVYGAFGRFGPTHLITALVKNKTKFSQSIEAIVEHNFDKIIVSHGDLVKENGKALFLNAFSKVMRH